jgi:hypothetical protein
MFSAGAPSENKKAKIFRRISLPSVTDRPAVPFYALYFENNKPENKKAKATLQIALAFSSL